MAVAHAGHAQDTFTPIFIDLERYPKSDRTGPAERLIGSYSADRGAERWQRLVRDPRYTIFAACKRGLADLLRSHFWTELLDRKQPGSITDLGVGNGEKLQLIIEAVQSQTSVRDIVAIDISEPMLNLAYETVFRSVEVANRHFTAVRLDFTGARSASLRRRLHFYRDGCHVFFLLGSTWANHNEASLTSVLMRLLRPGDILVVGLECWKTRDNRAQTASDLLRPYQTETYRQFLIDERTSDRIDAPEQVEVSVEIGDEWSAVPNSRMIVTHMRVNGERVLCTSLRVMKNASCSRSGGAALYRFRTWRSRRNFRFTGIMCLSDDRLARLTIAEPQVPFFTYRTTKKPGAKTLPALICGHCLFRRHRLTWQATPPTRSCRSKLSC